MVGDGAQVSALPGFGTIGDGTTGAGEAAGAGIDGIVGTTGAGEAAGVGTTGAGEAAGTIGDGPVLGAHHMATITDSTILDMGETLRSIEAEEAFTATRIQSQAIHGP